jgi:hypothetical protein
MEKTASYLRETERGNGLSIHSFSSGVTCAASRKGNMDEWKLRLITSISSSDIRRGLLGSRNRLDKKVAILSFSLVQGHLDGEEMLGTVLRPNNR